MYEAPRSRRVGCRARMRRSRDGDLNGPIRPPLLARLQERSRKFDLRIEEVAKFCDFVPPEIIARPSTLSLEWL